MKRVTYTVTAARALRQYANRAKLIRRKIEQYAAAPASLANNVTPLRGVEAKRLRIGDFRVIFRETRTAVEILDIAPRGSAYE